MIFLLSDLSIDISLVFSSGSSDQLLLVSFQVEDCGRSVQSHPIINMLPIQIDPINKDRIFSTVGNKSVKMFDNFVEWQILSIFWSYQFLFDGGYVWFILDVSVTERAADIL